MRATKKFKYFSIKNVIFGLIGRVKRIDSILKETRDYYNYKTTYQAFTHWLLDVIQYGFVMEVIHITFTGWHGWNTLLWVVGLGLLWWLFLNTIDMITKIVKE